MRSVWVAVGSAVIQSSANVTAVDRPQHSTGSDHNERAMTTISRFIFPLSTAN